MKRSKTGEEKESAAMKVEVKKCSLCGKELPATINFFPADYSAPSGLRARCRQCEKKRRQERKKDLLSGLPRQAKAITRMKAIRGEAQ